ncbi:hypothetical protein QP028_05660 [Corynebacterium suedekumii]|nr:hypothetical protein QP028_05660 [Corynebacterium suedekumii]
MERNADQVTAAIAEARSAADAAGFGDRDARGDDPDIDPADRPKVSYGFELEGLTNAPDVADMEIALEAVPGVRARIVYPKATAWITAPDTVDPDVLVEIIAGFGITAVLTDLSLRRRVLRAMPGEGLAQRSDRRDRRERSPRRGPPGRSAATSRRRRVSSNRPAAPASSTPSSTACVNRRTPTRTTSCSPPGNCSRPPAWSSPCC